MNDAPGAPPAACGLRIVYIDVERTAAPFPLSVAAALLVVRSEYACGRPGCACGVLDAHLRMGWPAWARAALDPPAAAP